MSESETEPRGYWHLVEPYWNVVSTYDGGEVFLGEFLKLPIVSQHLYAAHWLQSEVHNGGFDQFCSNSTGVLAPEAKIAFEAIGMPMAAKLVGKYLAYWGPVYPRDQEVREEIWEALGEKEFGKDEDGDPFVKGFGDLDEPFFALMESENGGFWEAASAYALSHGVIS